MKEKSNNNCILCEYDTSTGVPTILKNGKIICMSCCIEILEPIYHMDYTGLPHLIFKHLLTTKFNRKKRKPISDYNNVFNSLLHKYNFMCLYCKNTEYLTIDHITPVSKGGNDNYENLQILCRKCNSKKGSKLVNYA